jgi:hypothetical protein
MKTDHNPEPAKEKLFYFLDGDKVETSETNTTGALIKGRLPEAKRGYALYLEGHGNEPDQLINDESTISLEKEKGPKRFYTVPPANFGLR